MPEGWEWATIGDIFLHNTGKALNASDMEGEILTYITTSNLYWDRFELSTLKEMLFTKSEIEKCTARKGDLLVCEGGDIGRAAIWQYDYDIRIQNHIHRLRGLGEVNHRLFLFWFMCLKAMGLIGGKGIGLMGLSSRELDKLEIPIPPLREQDSIVRKVDNLFITIQKLEDDCSLLMMNIEQSKSKILDLAIHGKLVPQDPADEPAIELLKQVNPAFQPSHNLHYNYKGALPAGWAICRLEDILEYEQPQAYIVESTEYSDSYSTPVLTPGKSFILGYSNESNGVYKTLPVIIFDDFTTESKYVDFPFKVKSSAMKILRTKGNIDIRYVAFFMSITKLAGDTHKRYWISEYSKLCIPLPPLEEQRRIVAKINKINEQLEILVADTL